jgi:hypothetical protein
MELVNVSASLKSKRGPKPADLTWMIGRTFGQFRVTAIVSEPGPNFYALVRPGVEVFRRRFQKKLVAAPSRHRHCAGVCLACGSTDGCPRASDVKAGKSTTCRCGSKAKFNEFMAAKVIESTSPAQRRAVFNAVVGPSNNRFSHYFTRELKAARKCGVARRLIGHIVRLHGQSLLAAYPDHVSIQAAFDANLVTAKEYNYVSRRLPSMSEPLELTLDEVKDALSDGCAFVEGLVKSAWETRSSWAKGLIKPAAAHTYISAEVYAANAYQFA